jgi:hypothetical protein
VIGLLQDKKDEAKKGPPEAGSQAKDSSLGAKRKDGPSESKQRAKRPRAASSNPSLVLAEQIAGVSGDVRNDGQSEYDDDERKDRDSARKAAAAAASQSAEAEAKAKSKGHKAGSRSDEKKARRRHVYAESKPQRLEKKLMEAKAKGKKAKQELQKVQRTLDEMKKQNEAEAEERRKKDKGKRAEEKRRTEDAEQKERKEREEAERKGKEDAARQKRQNDQILAERKATTAFKRQLLEVKKEECAVSKEEHEMDEGTEVLDCQKAVSQLKRATSVALLKEEANEQIYTATAAAGLARVRVVEVDGQLEAAENANKENRLQSEDRQNKFL